MRVLLHPPNVTFQVFGAGSLLPFSAVSWLVLFTADMLSLAGFFFLPLRKSKWERQKVWDTGTFPNLLSSSVP